MVTLERVTLRPSVDRSLQLEDINREYLQKQIGDSINTLLNEQHPKSHIFPAATQKRFVPEGHYNHSWLRDNAMIIYALLDHVWAEVGDPTLVKEGREAAVDGIKGNLALFTQEPWNSAFEQKIEQTKDAYGRDCTKLTQPAPPIHFTINGENCAWPTQNQPDSWGSFLIAVGQAVNQGVLELTDKEKGVVADISGFLGRARVDSLQQHSMWEWGVVYMPCPTSTLALCAKGLELAIPIVQGSQKEVNRRTAGRLREAAQNQYPVEYTVTEGHQSKSDMATLVAAHAGALDGLFLSGYFNIAHRELGNGQDPGKRRYLGDHYYRTDQGEAIWPMGALLEANFFLEKAITLRNHDPSSKTAEQFRQLGLKSLQNVQGIIDKWGYCPELLQNTKEGLIPNNNHLLWNEALMLQASTRALVLV